MSRRSGSEWQLGRRAFLRNGSLLLAAAGLEKASLADLVAEQEHAAPVVRGGLVTDVHHADKPPGGSRHYRESLSKLAEAAGQFSRDKTDFVVELGDFIDAAPSLEQDREYLQRVHAVFSAIPGTKHYVLGNHCVDMLTKAEFLETVGQGNSYYSFDAGGTHFVVLDACFRSDGMPYERKNFEWTDPNIPPVQIEWLQQDLERTQAAAIVFVHQRLDNAGTHSVKNAQQVRRVLEQSGRVSAVFQGHSHKNDYQEIAGIGYCTLMALVEGSGPENSAYATLDVFADGSMCLRGFRRQKPYAWS